MDFSTGLVLLKHIGLSDDEKYLVFPFFLKKRNSGERHKNFLTETIEKIFRKKSHTCGGRNKTVETIIYSFLCHHYLSAGAVARQNLIIKDCSLQAHVTVLGFIFFAFNNPICI